MAGTDPKKDIKDIEKELNALKAKLDKTTSDSLEKLIQILKSGGASLSEWNTQLNLFSIKADQLSDDLDYVAKSLADSVNELGRGNEYLNQQIRSTRKLGSIAQDLLSMRRGDTTYDLKKIKSLEEQAKKHRQILESQIDQFSGDQEALDALNAKIAVSNDLLNSFQDITKEAKKFQKTMGLTGKLLVIKISFSKRRKHKTRY
jgi:septal ring factor EnvC (AmiA/AmiB activator)